ncbi:hypothetical protein KCP71_10285 [Salmonella enterica subsp. enterica]|nr:hypothetical protein KCP71_10285 [Salmonella enterica subsp. enterica]
MNSGALANGEESNAASLSLCAEYGVFSLPFYSVTAITTTTRTESDLGNILASLSKGFVGNFGTTAWRTVLRW